MNRYKSLLIAFFSACSINLFAQVIEKIEFDQEGLYISSFIIEGENYTLNKLPLLSYQVNDQKQITFSGKLKKLHDTVFHYEDEKIIIEFATLDNFSQGWKCSVKLTNNYADTLKINNIVPFGATSNKVHITGKGNHYLSRTYLFRPGCLPVNVIVPDNAWDLGFSEISVGEFNICALARRTGHSEKTKKRRFNNYLPPGESVTYTFWAETYHGDWQNGLKKIFRERMLYDIEPGTFNDTLYQREDLKWIRHAYVSHLIMAWDDMFYDGIEQRYTIDEFLEQGKQWYGGDDFIAVWPTWPTLGLDQRNQWDLYKDLPGGLNKINQLADSCRKIGTNFFISYNPWDKSTRDENHYEGMAKLIAAIGADGVVLDTKGSSSPELQEAADSVRKGVIMYSEGMAVPEDMQYIISGRVHNALYYPPMLNLNKFIKPDFAIFRVAEIKFERIRREYSLALFNGYGIEINIFPPGRPYWAEKDYRYLGRVAQVLRENSLAFTSGKYVPLIPTLKDSIWVNHWKESQKELYTIFSLIPEGFQGPLFSSNPEPNTHFVDLWNHEEIVPDTINSKLFLPVSTNAFHKKWLGTNNEGAAGAIAKFPTILQTGIHNNDSLTIAAQKGNEIRVWKGDPAYGKNYFSFDCKRQTISIKNKLGSHEGKLVVQLLDNEELIDERVLWMDFASPGLVSQKMLTGKAKKAPNGMVKIPAGSYKMEIQQGDDFIPYPKFITKDSIHISSFFMDKHPVTNKKFKGFLDATNYKPKDTANFLKHWINSKIPSGRENYPVVYVSYEDAQAYAKWAGKRLPTEIEWQYAAQAGETSRKWPWSEDKVNMDDKESITKTLTISKFDIQDSSLCNTGNGKMDAVGSYPKGSNSWGLHDLVGCVWQITNDVYYNGAYRFIILKGGSYFNPGSSWWYVQGGPRPLTWRQMLLRVSPGFERNATVGFRCVKDIK